MYISRIISKEKIMDYMENARSSNLDIRENRLDDKKCRTRI